MQDVALCGGLKEDSFLPFNEETQPECRPVSLRGERLQIQEDSGSGLFLQVGAKQVRDLTCVQPAHVDTLRAFSHVFIYITEYVTSVLFN